MDAGDGTNRLTGSAVDTFGSVNDPFVMAPWGENHNASGNVTMLADTCGDFTKAVDLELDLSAVLGTVRSKRFSIVVENGKAVKVNVEPDGTDLSCSLAENIFNPRPMADTTI